MKGKVGGGDLEDSKWVLLNLTMRPTEAMGIAASFPHAHPVLNKQEAQSMLGTACPLPI